MKRKKKKNIYIYINFRLTYYSIWVNRAFLTAVKVFLSSFYIMHTYIVPVCLESIEYPPKKRFHILELISMSAGVKNASHGTRVCGPHIY